MRAGGGQDAVQGLKFLSPSSEHARRSGKLLRHHGRGGQGRGTQRYVSMHRTGLQNRFRSPCKVLSTHAMPAPMRHGTFCTLIGYST